MKSAILSVILYLILTIISGKAQSPAVVCIDNINISTDGNFQTDKKIDQLVSILIFGVDEKINLKVAEQTSYKLNQPKSITFRFDSSLISKADYALRGRVFLGNDAAFTFNVRDLKSGKVYYLPPVHSPLDNLLSGSSSVTDDISDLIADLDVRKLSSFAKFNVVGDFKIDGRGKITEEEALSALFAIVDRADVVQHDALSNNSKSSRFSNTELTLKLNFSKSKESIVMLPVIYGKGLLGDSLTLIESVFDLHDKRQLLSERRDLQSLVDLLIITNHVSKANVGSLILLRATSALPTLQLIDTYLDSAATRPHSAYKALLLIKKRLTGEHDYNTYLRLAQLRQIQKRSDDAIESLILAAKNTSDKVDKTNAYAKAAAINYSSDRYFDALSLYENISLSDPNFNSPEYGELNFLKGKLYCKVSQYDQAAKYLETSLTVKPTKKSDFPFENQYWLGFVYFYQGKIKLAIDNLSNVYEWNHSYAEMLPIYLSDCYRNLAQENLTKGNYPRADTLIRQSLKFKDNRDSQLMLLKILNRLGRINESRQYIAAHMNEPIVLRIQARDLKALFYGRHKNQFATEAIHFYRGYLLQRSSDSVALYDIGNIYNTLNKIDSAVHFFEKARTSQYPNPGLYLDLAEAYIKSKNPAQVLEVFRTINNKRVEVLSGERNIALQLYLTVIAKRLLKQDYGSESRQLEQKFTTKNKIISGWDFIVLKKWILASDASTDDKEFIDALTLKMTEISA